MSRGSQLHAGRVAGVAGASMGLGLALVLCATTALASVRRSGTWPSIERERVTLSAKDLPRAEAIRRLAEKAGWSVVVQGATTGTVDVQVKNQPAAKVLELILAEGSFVARRDGDLVSIERAAPETHAAAEVPPAVVANPAGAAGAAGRARSTTDSRDKQRPHGEDRVVTGSSLTVERGEVVGDLVVLGGSAEVLGTVSGDVAIFAGSLQVRSGGHVYGDVATFGGSVTLEDGARVDGDLSVLGGSVQRDENAVVGGDSSGLGAHDEEGKRHELRAPWRRAADTLGGVITRGALLFAFGAVLWALAGRRVERLQVEVAVRPMRSFALGIVGLLCGVMIVIVLCVTIIGIPIALVTVLAGAFGAYAGVCAALTAAGAALVRHRTASPYVHLALGCALYLLLSSVPFVGGFVTAAVALVGFGALVGTRAAGLIKRRGARSASPPSP